MGNPKDNPLLTGKGTPWGPMDTGRPDAPAFQALATDPNQFNAFDRSGQKASLQRDIGLAGGQAARSFGAQASKMLGSGTRSSNTAGRLADIAAQTEKNKIDASNQIAFQEWEDKKSLMDAFNRARMAANDASMRKYDIDSDAFGKEQQGRGDFWSGLAQAGGQIAGGLLAKSPISLVSKMKSPGK